MPLCVRFCRTDCGWPCCRNCWAPAGDTALLLADCADSRALLAAQVLARRFRHLRLETGAEQEALERQLLRQLGLTTGGGPAAVTVTFGPPPREGLPLYLTPDCALRQEVRYAWPDPPQAPPPEGLLSLLHRACRLPEICVKPAHDNVTIREPRRSRRGSLAFFSCF